MTLISHLKELRKRLFYSLLSVVVCSIVVYTIYPSIIAILSKPMVGVDSALSSYKFVVSTLFEGFVVKFKFSLIGGAVLSLPILLYQVLRFIFPALKRKEKFILLTALISGLILGVFSLYLAFYKLLPFSITFLTTHQFIPTNVGVMLQFQQNIFYVFNFLLFSTLLFQFPIVLTLLMYFKLLSRKALWGASRYIFVALFFVSALITPPDIISQITLALPMTVLYFLTILLAKLLRIGAD